MFGWFKSKFNKRSDDEILQLIRELLGTSVDPTIAISCLSLLAWQTSKDPHQEEHGFVKEWLQKWGKDSVINPESQLASFQFMILKVLYELVADNKDIEPFVMAHDPIDPVFLHKNLLPAADRGEFSMLVEKLGSIAVYFMRTQDINELTLPTQIIEKNRNLDWRFEVPVKEEDGLKFVITSQESD